MRKRGDRRRAVVQAGKETAEEIVLANVALRAGQVLWFVVTSPARLLARLLADA